MAGRADSMTRGEVLQLVAANGERIRGFGVERLRLFGSHVRDEARATSDVDFLVDFAPGRKTFDNLMGLSVFLEGLFQRRVELVTPEALSPYIGPRILREAVHADLSA